MVIEVQGRILTAEGKAYEFDGRKGISNRIRVLVDSEIFNLKATPELVAEASERIGENVTCTIAFNSRKEVLSATMTSFE